MFTPTTRRLFARTRVSCSPNSLLWGSLLGKKGWPRAVAAFLELVRHVSAWSPLWPRLQTLSDCPPFVRLVSAVVAPPDLVRHEPAMCPPCLRLVSALAAPPCVCFGHASRFGFPSKPRPPCVGQALCPPRLVSALCRLWPRLQALCFPFCPLCPPCVRSLSFLCSLVVRSLSTLCSVLGRVYGLALTGPLSALCPFFGFCAFVCSVSVVVRLSRGLCGRAFAGCSSGHL